MCTPYIPDKIERRQEFEVHLQMHLDLPGIEMVSKKHLIIINKFPECITYNNYFAMFHRFLLASFRDLIPILWEARLIAS